MARTRRLSYEIRALTSLYEGQDPKSVCADIGIDPRTLRRWRRRALTEIPPGDDVYAAALELHAQANSEKVRADILRGMLRAIEAQAAAARQRRCAR